MQQKNILYSDSHLEQFLDATASQDSTSSEWGVHSPFKNSISLVTWWWNSEWGVHFPFKNSISHQSEEYILHLKIPSVWWWWWNSGDMMMEFSHQLVRVRSTFSTLIFHQSCQSVTWWKFIGRKSVSQLVNCIIEPNLHLFYCYPKTHNRMRILCKSHR